MCVFVAKVSTVKYRRTNSKGGGIRSLFRDQTPQKNVAGCENRTHDHLHTRRMQIRLSYHDPLIVTELQTDW